jgi:DNA-binding winged helix-turn-helix (wHTH) protein/TolB-like protein/Tfp pilus assembly protein PilF
MSLSTKDFYVFGPYRLDAVGGVLFHGERVVALPPKQIATLILLVRAGGTVVDRESLVSQVWPDTFVEEAGLTRNISQLRKAIEANGVTYIETIPKRGYRFVAPVAIERREPDTVRLVERVISVSVEEETDDDLPPAPMQIDRNAEARARWIIPSAIGTIVIASLAAVAMLGRPTTPEPSTTSVRTMAVLPFRHLNPEDSDRYLSVGLADALITRFANLRTVATSPTSSVLALAGRDALDAGRALRVDAVIDGTIRRSPDRVRVTVQLLDVVTGRQMWAGSFDERSQDLLAVEDAVATAVAGLLVPGLGKEERARLSRRGTQSPLAWQHYTRARALVASRSFQGVQDAIDAFHAAIQADPGYALAYAGLSMAYNAQAGYQYRPAREVYPAARAAATRAVELDPLLGDAHTALGGVSFSYDWDWTTAEREIRRGLALNPNDAAAHLYLAGYLMAMGHREDSLVAARAALALEPNGYSSNANLALMLNWAGHYEESIAQANHAMQLPDSNPAILALYNTASYYLLGRHQEATAMLERARTIAGDIPVVTGFTARMAAATGDRARALSLLAEMERRREKEYVDAIFIAAPLVDAGEIDRALVWIRQMVIDKSEYVPYLAIDPSFAKLRDDPRFVEILRVVGIDGALKAPAPVPRQ